MLPYAVAGSQYTPRLFLADKKPLRSLVRRLLVVLGLIALAWLMLWLERTGLRDSRGTPLGPLDVLYFAVVTVTTLGYGDIVPVSNEARAIITFGITPLRVLTFLVFLSTAYEFVLRRSIELLEMEKLKRSLDGHTLICGFGVKGRTAVQELLRRGVPASQIVVLDIDPAAADEANRLGVTFYHGTASSEQALKDVAVEKADHAIVVPNNDEACVLIVLTMRELSPRIRIRAAAREEENIKLIKRSGADTVIAPSVDGGRLLASSTSSPLATDMVHELLEHGEGADIFDYAVKAADVGKVPSAVPALKSSFILGVRTGAGERVGTRRATSRKLEAGDVVIAYLDEEAP